MGLASTHWNDSSVDERRRVLWDVYNCVDLWLISAMRNKSRSYIDHPTLVVQHSSGRRDQEIGF